MVIKWSNQKNTVQNIRILTATLSNQKINVQNIRILTATLSNQKITVWNIRILNSHYPKQKTTVQNIRILHSHFSHMYIAGFAGICGNLRELKQKTTAPDIEILQPPRGYIKKLLLQTLKF